MDVNKLWEVKFELYGKKMKATIEADSMYTAQLKIKDKIIFHSTEEKRKSAEEMINNVYNGIFK